jgi:hypothetical protein
MSNRTRSTVRNQQHNNDNDDDDSDAAATCCVIRILVCFLIVTCEIPLIQMGYTFSGFTLLWWLLLLLAPRRRRVAATSNPESAAQDISSAAISPAIRLERRQAFAAKVAYIKQQILDCPTFPGATVNHEQADGSSTSDLSMLERRQLREGPTNGMYNVHAREHIRHGRLPFQLEKYKLELLFSKSGQGDGCWSIQGQGCSISNGSILFIVKEGQVKEWSDGRGVAYWVGETPTSGGRAHVASGNFDFRTNSFRGKFSSETGRTGYYVTFELHQPDASHQLVPTDDPDLEAPMAEVVSFDRVDDATTVTTLEEEDAHDEARLNRLLSKHETNAVAHMIPTANAVAEVMTPGAKPISNNPRRPKPNTVSLLGPSGRKPLPSDFRQAVTVASMETTEVNAGSRKKVIATDPLNGSYDIQFESQDDSSTVLTHNKTMDLTFTRGFCGWDIHGTRRNHKNDDDDDGLFSIQRGFLAQSGKMYWEERRELNPSYSVLVVGMLDADTAGTFHGEWLSSRKRTTNTRGKFLKFIRRDDNAQHENVAALSSGAIV